MCGGSETGSYVRLIDFVYHSTLGLRVIKKKKKVQVEGFRFQRSGFTVQAPGPGARGSWLRVQGVLH
jgi:hypothetical protein